jgi:hypothetical protein
MKKYRTKRYSINSVRDLKKRILKQGKDKEVLYNRYLSSVKAIEEEKIRTKQMRACSALYHDLAMYLGIFVRNEALNTDDKDMLKVLTRILNNYEEFKKRILPHFDEKQDELAEFASLNGYKFQRI